MSSSADSAVARKAFDEDAARARIRASTTFEASDAGLEALGATADDLTNARRLGTTAAQSVLASRRRPQRFR